MLTTPIYRTWQRRVGLPVWEESWIRQFRLAIWTRALGYPPGGHATNLTDDEAHMLWDQFRHTPHPRVTDIQAAKGRAWLADTGRRLGLPDLPYDDITGFTFDDVHLVDETRWHVVTAPVYTGRWRDGSTLTYWATPWTQGSDITYRHTEAA